MSEIQYQIINPLDDENIALIAAWYANEWNIPLQTTTDKIKNLSEDEFQVLMTLNNKPIATGGIYHKVGLVDKEPRFKIYKNWLALVYTLPEKRGNGNGTLICKHIQDYSKTLGLKEIYLFTHTAENLYKRLGWQELEKILLNDKHIAIMKKTL